jgi:hypothetical protein
MKRCGLAMLALVLCGLAQAAPESVSLSCAVAYQPARSTWVRQVQIEWDDKTVHALRVDGLTPHSFSVQADVVLTAIDNERIQIDLGQAVWTSDFRGLASGQGRCETERP